ncbi:MAG: aldehyde dehydrogenase family protein [Acidimicrobiia bacterium]|nr:aldehyde dehydrogenase family protein [Acidimicrobiia bacterium]
MSEALTELEAGMPIVFGGDRVTRVPAELAAAFRKGDRLVVVPDDGALLHIPAAEHELVTATVGDALDAFATLGATDDTAVTAFYEAFADRLADQASFAAIAEANAADVDSAKARGRSTTRLELSERMRADMVAGLGGWARAPSGRDGTVETVHHDGWRVDLRRAGLGVVGFVFEGRPNVFADATGVLRSGNAVVFRIGSDALGTARAIVAHALAPALHTAGLPSGAARLLDSPSRAAGWALFADPRLALAVARGSGGAVAQLGAVARQTGTPVSLHGTGGAWLVAGDAAGADELAAAVLASLDRKVCNTLNVCCVPAARAAELVGPVLAAVDEAAARRGTAAKLHVARGSEAHVPAERFTRQVVLRRAEGEVTEAQAELLEPDELGREWEWEESPEVSLVVTDTVDAAVELFNRSSPRLVACLVSADRGEHERFWALVDAPFVGNGFTRWVDGQFALDRPELGLSSWQHGRLFARGGVLSGDSVYTIRTRAWQDDPGLHR